MNFITYEDMINCLYKNIGKIPRDIDLVVGIPRSGLMVANIIALFLNLPLVDLDGFLQGRVIATGKTRRDSNWVSTVYDVKKILVVDDSISTGEAIKCAKEKIANSYFKGDAVYCAIYALPTNFFSVDIYFAIINHPRLFEWNYLHHWILKHACVDIDGVLCEDPTCFQNDDGESYQKFLLNAVPRFLPTKKIGFIVTTRLEKYRSQTEAWLKRYGIDYNSLVMLNVNSASDRRRNIDQGEFKGEIYKKSDCVLFLESNYEQAIKICDVSNKAVFCVDNRKLVTPAGLQSHIITISNDWRITLKRALKKIIYKN